MSFGLVPHCMLCFLVWWLTIGHVCWCSNAQSAMPVGMVPYYRPCLLECHLPIGHSCWSVATAINIILLEFRWKRAGYKSGATLTEGPLHQICLPILFHSQMCLFVQCNSIRHACWVHLSDTHFFVKCFSIKQDIWSHGFVKLVSNHTGHHLEYIKF